MIKLLCGGSPIIPNTIDIKNRSSSPFLSCRSHSPKYNSPDKATKPAKIERSQSDILRTNSTPLSDHRDSLPIPKNSYVPTKLNLNTNNLSDDCPKKSVIEEQESKEKQEHKREESNLCLLQEKKISHQEQLLIDKDNAYRSMYFTGGLFFRPKTATPRTLQFLKVRGIGVEVIDTGSPVIVDTFAHPPSNRFKIDVFKLDIQKDEVESFLEQKKAEDIARAKMRW